MSASATLGPRIAAPQKRQPLVDNAVLGTLIFVITEATFFAALISAFLVIKASTGNTWVPPHDVRLPVLATLLNTLVLTLSGALTWRAGRAFARPGEAPKAERFFGGAIVLGAFFVLFQGYEWVKLIAVGMTMSSSVFGATFYLLIGSHGLHACGAILAMVYVLRRMKVGKMSHAGFKAMRIFWYFIVGVWPILYSLVYF